MNRTTTPSLSSLSLDAPRVHLPCNNTITPLLNIMKVFDEFVGIWFALLGMKNLFLIIPAFIIFRFLDIFKPWPISFFDREIRGGWGIMLDDLAAGAMVFCLIQLYFWFPRLIS